MEATPNTIRLGLVDDQLLFRKGLRTLLEGWPEFQIIFEAGEGYSVVESLRQSEVLPQVLLVDLNLPPDGTREYSGLDLTLDLQAAFPDIQVLILSMHDDPYFISQLIEKGAKGYLVKDCDPEELHQAILSVHGQGTYINARTLQAIQSRLQGGKAKSPMPTTPLTRREEEIIKLICQQMTAEEIGEALFISPKTVNGHRNNLLQKTGSRNVTGLVLYAIKHGLVTVI